MSGTRLAAPVPGPAPAPAPGSGPGPPGCPGARERPGRGEERGGGFTLVEVIVAVVLLTVGLLASVSMVSLAARTLGEARRASLAGAAAESLADSLLRSGRAGASGMRSYPWGVLRWGAGEGAGETRVVATDSGRGEEGVAAAGAEGATVLVELFLRLPEAAPASPPER